MKILILLLTGTALIAAEPKESVAELKKQLAASQAALSAERAEKATFKAGTQKLTEAVLDANETNKENGAKVEAAADRLIESQASGAKAAEKVAAATQSATKKITDVVTTNQTAVTTAIAEQTRQAEKALAAAREVARKAEENSRNLAKTAEEIKLAKEKTDQQLARANKSLDDLTRKTDLAAAKDETMLSIERYKMITTIGVPLIGVFSILAFVFQIKANNQQKATHVMLNGKSELKDADIKEKDARIRDLEDQINNTRRNGGSV